MRACIGICCCVRDANNDAAIVRSSLGVRCLFAAVPVAARRMIERCRRRCPGRLKCHPPRAHQLFDEQPSIGGYLRTEPRRSRIEAPTNCGRFAPSLWAHSSQNRYRYAHGSLWMPRLFSGGGIGPKTFLRSGARAALTRAAVLPQRRIDDSVVSASALPAPDHPLSLVT